MLENIFKNSIRVNSEKIHCTQIAFYSEKQNFVSLNSLELFLYICFSVNFKFEYNADKILDLENLKF